MSLYFNMCSEVAGLIGRLIGCFGLNGSSKQYFSLNQPSPKEQEKKREMKGGRKECPNNPDPHLFQAQ